MMPESGEELKLVGEGGVCQGFREVYDENGKLEKTVTYKDKKEIK